MGRMHKAVAAALLAVALVAAGCGGGSDKKSTTGATDGTPSGGGTTGLSPGVTASSIKLGVAMVDFDCIAAFVDETRPSQRAAFQAFIDDVNTKGGINGRKLVPVYKTVCPINPAGSLAACTAFADDDNVFAVVGGFGDITGDVPLCMTKQHKRILITYVLSDDTVAKAPPGLLLTPDILPGRRIKVIMSLLKTEKKVLAGKTVAVLADASSSERVNKVVEPGLKSLGVKRGSTAILTISGTGDTTAAQSQLDSFIERWKTEHVNALVMAGEGVTSKQFVEKMKSAFPNITLISDNTDTIQGARDETKAGVKPNPYEGMISAEGRTGDSHQTTAHFKRCKAIFEGATGSTIPRADAVVKAKNGKRDDTYGEEEDACATVTMFTEIATKVGKDLNNANWTKVVNGYGKIDVPTTDFASIHTGKYDADDTYGLVAFDSSIGDAGDWKRLTPIRDVSG